MMIMNAMDAPLLDRNTRFNKPFCLAKMGKITMKFKTINKTHGGGFEYLAYVRPISCKRGYKKDEENVN